LDEDLKKNIKKLIKYIDGVYFFVLYVLKIIGNKRISNLFYHDKNLKIFYFFN